MRRICRVGDPCAVGPPFCTGHDAEAWPVDASQRPGLTCDPAAGCFNACRSARYPLQVAIICNHVQCICYALPFVIHMAHSSLERMSKVSLPVEPGSHRRQAVTCAASSAVHDARGLTEGSEGEDSVRGAAGSGVLSTPPVGERMSGASGTSSAPGLCGISARRQKAP